MGKHLRTRQIVDGDDPISLRAEQLPKSKPADSAEAVYRDVDCHIHYRLSLSFVSSIAAEALWYTVLNEEIDYTICQERICRK